MTEVQTQAENEKAQMPISNVADEVIRLDISAMKPVDMPQRIVMLDPDEIVMSEGLNMRRYPPTAAYLEELARDIVMRGQLQPVLVRRGKGSEGLDGKNVLVFGFGRVKAVAYANEKKLAKTLKPSKPFSGKVAALVVTDSMDDLEAISANVSENMKRQEVSHIDQAHVCKTYLDMGVSRSDIARMLKKVPSWVTEHLALVDLPSAIQKKVHIGVIPYTAVREFGGMEEDERDKFVAGLEEGTVTRDKVRKKAKKKKQEGKASKTMKEVRTAFTDLSEAERVEGEEYKYSKRVRAIGEVLSKWIDGKMGVKVLANKLDEAR